MAHPYHHALSSVKQWGGTPEDYNHLHSWFDESKGACRKPCNRSRKSLGTPDFQGLLTNLSPKQNASSSFCFWTVHSPAKSKPFFNQSMASKPAIVRFAEAKV